MKISIIMVNYNGVRYLSEKVLKDSIGSFLSVDYPNFEFIFLDNGSNDESVRVANEVFREYPNVVCKIVQINENLGFAGGCQEGMKYVTGEYIVLVNTDDKALNGNWLMELLKVIRSDKAIGATFAKKLRWDRPKCIDAMGLTMNIAGLITQIGEGKRDEKENDYVHECLIWQTPVMIRKGILERIGGLFDDDYVILNDDVDCSLRIWLAGYKVMLVPTAVVIHKRSATMKHLPAEFVRFHGRKNTIQTLIKNYELNNLIKWLPVLLTIYIIASFYYVLIGRADESKATVKAILWNFTNIKKILRKRTHIQRYVRRVSDRRIMKYMRRFSIEELLRRREYV